MHVSIAYSNWFWSTQYNTQHCMNGEADNSRFVSMYVYMMHSAFKELISYNNDYKAGWKNIHNWYYF